MSYKSLPQLVATFDPELLRKLFGKKNEDSLKELFGPYFELWRDIFYRLHTVDQILAQSSDNLSFIDLSSCGILLTNFMSMPPKLSAQSFALIVEQVDPRITRMIFEMINRILANTRLTSALVAGRKHFIKYECDPPPPIPGAILYIVSYNLFESMSKILSHWQQLKPVSMHILASPILATRLPFCSFQVACVDAITPLPMRQMMLCRSGHFFRVFSHILSNNSDTPSSKQRIACLQKVFGLELTKKLLK